LSLSMLSTFVILSIMMLQQRTPSAASINTEQPHR
jgi:hypothetical protein